MVTVTNFKINETQEGKTFCSLQVESGIESVQGKSGRYYLTTRSCWISTTFTDNMCKSLIGKSLPGKVVKVECEPYEFTAKGTGEVLLLDYRWEYSPEEDGAFQNPHAGVPQHLVVG
jgi:hypothetical protein